LLSKSQRDRIRFWSYSRHMNQFWTYIFYYSLTGKKSAESKRKEQLTKYYLDYKINDTYHGNDFTGDGNDLKAMDVWQLYENDRFITIDIRFIKMNIWQ
jgi:hypothetical protein